MCDNFTLTHASSIDSLDWVGGYYNPPRQGPITAWTATLYFDNAGQPGGAFAGVNQTGTASETFIAKLNGFLFYLFYLYWLDFPDIVVQPGTYWVSVVPDLAFPPQWGWTSGTGEAMASPTRTSRVVGARYQWHSLRSRRACDF